MNCSAQSSPCLRWRTADAGAQAPGKRRGENEKTAAPCGAPAFSFDPKVSASEQAFYLVQQTAAAATLVTPRHVAMNWARRLKRVFGSIEQPEVIAKILSHLQRIAPEQYGSELSLGARAPPMQSRLL